MKKLREPLLYTSIALAMLLWYLFSAYAAAQVRYGFDQLKHLPPETSSALILAILLSVVIAMLRDRGGSASVSELPYSRLILPALILAVLFAVTAWQLRSGFPNDDGLNDMLSLQAGQSILRHDEMLPTLIVTMVYESGITGILPEKAFSLVSCFFGGLFVFTTVLFGGRMTGRRWPLFIGLSLSAGYVQMFVGDAEVYAMVAAMLAVYFLLCSEYLKGNISLLLPSLTLAVALCSHLLAGWTVPAFAFLLYRSIRRKRYAETGLSVLVFLITVGFLFFIVTAAGLPLHALASSNAAGAGNRNTLDMLAVPEIHYHAAVANVLFLVFPFWLVLPALLLTGRLKSDLMNAVLIISAGMLTLLALVWKLALRPYFDWNLIASVGVPLSYLTWSSLLRGPWQRGMKSAVLLLCLVGALHSWTWITANHFSFNMLHKSQIEDRNLPTPENRLVFELPEN